MGWLDGLRRSRRAGAAQSPDRREVGPSLEDMARFRRALLDEAQRLGRTTGLALTIFMEHTDFDLASMEIYDVLGHLEAEGEIVNVQRDSFGNLKFDVTPMAERLQG